MLICTKNPHCTKLDGYGGLHGTWSAALGDYVPLEFGAAENTRPARNAQRHEKAERIARKALDNRAYIPGDRMSFQQALHVATSAALAALTEMENAR